MRRLNISPFLSFYNSANTYYFNHRLFHLEKRILSHFFPCKCKILLTPCPIFIHPCGDFPTLLMHPPLSYFYILHRLAYSNFAKNSLIIPGFSRWFFNFSRYFFMDFSSDFLIFFKHLKNYIMVIKILTQLVQNCWYTYRVQWRNQGSLLGGAIPR